MAKGTARSLNKAQIKRFKALLEAKAEELRTSLGSSMAAKALAHGEEPLDLEEMPGQSHEEWIFVNRNNIDVMLLRKIEEALTRIEEEGYGTCLECDEVISLKRMQAIPWARYCVPCQEELSSEPSEPVKERRSYSY
jgi:DnaK suppressor protein